MVESISLKPFNMSAEDSLIIKELLEKFSSWLKIPMYLALMKIISKKH